MVRWVREHPRTRTKEDSSLIENSVEQKLVGVAGDPFAYAGGRALGCPVCFGGYVTITVEEDGVERDEAVPCRRCSG
jgi:hypothetical protein